MAANHLAADDFGTPVPLMGLRPESGQKLAITTTSTRSTQIEVGVNTGAYVVVEPTVDCYLEVGNYAVTANTTNSHYCKANRPRELYIPKGKNYIAVIRHESGSANGVLYLSQYDGEV